MVFGRRRVRRGAAWHSARHDAPSAPSPGRPGPRRAPGERAAWPLRRARSAVPPLPGAAGRRSIAAPVRLRDPRAGPRWRARQESSMGTPPSSSGSRSRGDRGDERRGAADSLRRESPPPAPRTRRQGARRTRARRPSCQASASRPTPGRRATNWLRSWRPRCRGARSRSPVRPPPCCLHSRR